MGKYLSIMQDPLSVVGQFLRWREAVILSTVCIIAHNIVHSTTRQIRFEDRDVNDIDTQVLKHWFPLTHTLTIGFGDWGTMHDFNEIFLQAKISVDDMKHIRCLVFAMVLTENADDCLLAGQFVANILTNVKSELTSITLYGFLFWRDFWHNVQLSGPFPHVQTLMIDHLWLMNHDTETLFPNVQSLVCYEMDGDEFTNNLKLNQYFDWDKLQVLSWIKDYQCLTWMHFNLEWLPQTMTHLTLSDVDASILCQLLNTSIFVQNVQIDWCISAEEELVNTQTHKHLRCETFAICIKYHVNHGYIDKHTATNFKNKCLCVDSLFQFLTQV